jgi:hypothetical protein
MIQSDLALEYGVSEHCVLGRVDYPFSSRMFNRLPTFRYRGDQQKAVSDHGCLVPILCHGPHQKI